MGGGGGGGLGTLARIATASATFGFSEVGNIPGTGRVGQTIGNLAKDSAAAASPFGWAVAGAARTGQGIASAPKNAADAAQRAQDAQNKTSADLVNQMKMQPQIVQSDNYLAQKAKQLNSLRMGIAATMRGGGGAGPVTAAPALKSKLGQ